MEALLTELEMFFSALSDRTRLSITLLLMDKGEMTVDEITKQLRKSQSLISHHLSCLRNCGVVKVRKDGKYSYYSIYDENVRKLITIAINIVKEHSQSILGCEVLAEEKGIKVSEQK
ncbi:metalloregulator ArsR/SmtB family transcription factor [Sulfurisphaera javensis]|uniref:Metalloregulator ArsR/SmtB family transcription factor n=1 Tax=Sulfurisphaera javensis TaxID=2049879 RepID=A0AAT9GQA2_9CREN